MTLPRKTRNRKLYGKQPLILATIAQSLLEKGHAPTMKDIAYRHHLTRSATARTVGRLIQLGYLKRTVPLGTLRVELPGKS